MKNTLLLSLLLLAGCASSEPTLTIKVDSKPRGVTVFVKNKTRVGRFGLTPTRGEMGLIPEWDPVGTTPFKLTWPLPVSESDSQVIPLVFEARPPDNTSGLHTQREICHPNIAHPNGKNGTWVIFFDLTKP
jgi:hypothetical protein